MRSVVEQVCGRTGGTPERMCEQLMAMPVRRRAHYPHNTTTPMVRLFNASYHF
jgi:hypothetical protein